MIVSHQHQFIFFAVPKTATHAVREALRKQAGSDCWEQQVLQGQQYLPIPELAKVGHGHISASQAQQFLPSEIWSNYKKVAFVRNPFDRFVSACAFLTRGNGVFAEQFGTDPTQWMKLALQRAPFRARVLVQPQTDLLYCADRLGMDFVGRYETLSQSFAEMCDLLGIQQSELQQKNTSAHKPWYSYYDDQLRAMVSEFYAADLDNFNYSSGFPA